MQQEFKKNITDLLQINLEINVLLKNNMEKIKVDEESFAAFQSEIENLLSKKNSFIEKLKNLKACSEAEFSELKNTKYKDDWQKVQEMENENLEMIKAAQSSINEEVAGIVKHSKAISSYKYTKELKPRLFDSEF